MSAMPPAPMQEEQLPCPVCQGVGTVPASMPPEEMVAAISAPPAPEQTPAEVPPSAPPMTAPAPPMDQSAELARLGERAQSRMRGPATIGGEY